MSMRKGLIIVLCFSLAACSVGGINNNIYTDNTPQLPTHWQLEGSTSATQGGTSGLWWQAFGSEELLQLIEQAEQNSYNVRAALANIRRAEAAVRIADASLWPELEGTVEAGRAGELNGNSNEHYYSGVTASYEIDFWGGQRANQASAQALLDYSQFDRDTLGLSITANVARYWLQWVGNRERLQITEANLGNARRLLDIVELKIKAGAASELEQLQQQGQVAGLERDVAWLRQQMQESHTTLNLLLGSPTDIPLFTNSLAEVEFPAIETGIPAELLVRRPDVARAEAALRAANANISQARAAMLPNISLAMSAGGSANHLSQTLRDPVYSLVAGLTAPIFNGGALEALFDSAVANRDGLVADYQQTIVAAFTDTRNAINAIAGIDAQRRAQQQQLDLARRAYDLAEARYRAGAASFSTLLDNQTTLFFAEDTNVVLRRQSLQARVDLFRALGGGWTPERIAQINQYDINKDAQ